MNKLKDFFKKLASKFTSKTFYTIFLVIFCSLFFFIFIVGVILPNTSASPSQYSSPRAQISSKSSDTPLPLASYPIGYPPNFSNGQYYTLTDEKPNAGRISFVSSGIGINLSYPLFTTTESRGMFCFSGTTAGLDTGIDFLSSSKFFTLAFYSFRIVTSGPVGIYYDVILSGSNLNGNLKPIVITDLDIDSPNFGQTTTVEDFTLFRITRSSNSIYTAPKHCSFLGSYLYSGTLTSPAPQFSYILGFFKPSTLFDSGFNTGYNEGYDVGYDKGLDNADDAAFDRGYASGYNAAQTDKLSNPLSFFIDPVQQFLDMKLFGVISLGSILSIALFILVAVIFLKIFAGG